MQPQLIAGRYQVLRAIGRGGMGTVWLCRDEILGREVAVKQIGALPGDSASETKRAMREARSAAALNHPNAVAVYDVVDHDSRPWLVMEYVEGETLADEIARDGMLSPQRVADVGAQLAGALARAHQRRIVHRDIKPGNVLIDKGGHPKISDFGIARGHGDEQLTQVGFITGTPGYLSPELARGGDPHPASDVWALGATLYAAVEGRPPYESRSNPIATLRAISTERPRPMAHAGVLAPAIDAMMHEDPACRWDMATSARRLGAIARAAALAAPKVDPTATRVIGAPLLDPPTQALAPTQRLKAAPVVAAAAVPAAAAAAAAAAAVSAAAASKPAAVAAPVAAPPVTKPPVVKAAPVAPPVVAEAPAVAPPVVAKPPVVIPPAAPTTAVAAAQVAAEPPVRASVAPGPGGPGGGAPVGPPATTGSGRRWIPLGLVGLLAIIVGAVFLFSQLGDPGPTTPGPVAIQTTAAAKPPASSEPTASQAPPATTAVPTQTTAAPSQTTTVAAPTTTAAATTAAATTAAANTDRQLESFVASYFSNVTQNREGAWAQLSPSMKSAAGGRGGFDGWWNTIRSVTVLRTRADAAGRMAEVRLTYNKRDGSSPTQTNRYTFVQSGGGYLIDSESQG